MAFEPIPGYDAWKASTPDWECTRCEDTRCDAGGLISGRDGDGRDTVEPCDCLGCHPDQERLEAAATERRWEKGQEAAKP